ncbi:dormancy-associated protein 1-like isoform X2 [Hibiscus syriacus]|uniref:dormancy-associated protein 1-like isoform X2 n=1 Tax=Hibiscus syriacus TaxID=106335 RepID=UPI001924B24E|nr:dormancy-associated protein 1-like isoform X2 [Hibiscus syriacus]
MVLLDKMWDDVLAGPQPERGLGKLRKITTQPLSFKDDGEGKRFQRSLSMPTRKENVWRSVFHPGRNLATKSIGADMFDRPQPNSPTVYDCNQREAQRQKAGKLGSLFGSCVEIIPFDQ